MTSCDSCGDSSPVGGTWRSLSKRSGDQTRTINICGHCDANWLIQELQEWEPGAATHLREQGFS